MTDLIFAICCALVAFALFTGARVILGRIDEQPDPDDKKFNPEFYFSMLLIGAGLIMLVFAFLYGIR